MSAPLRDSQAREAITARLGDSLFVEAGAGTGKTQALVDRVVGLVADGTSLGQVAAITFTDAAAGELRERIRRELERAARDESLLLLDTAGRGRCASAAAAFDDATITTLHGFAQRILAEHPLEAALPPGFEVADAVQASVGFRQRWTRFLDVLLDDPARERALVVLFALGLRVSAFERLARVLHDNVDRLDEPRDDEVGSITEPAIPAFDARLVVALLDAAVAFADRCSDDDDRLLQHLIDLRATADRLRGAADELEQLEVLADRRVFSTTLGRKEHWPDGVKAEILEVLGRAEDACVDAIDAVREPALRQVIDALTEFTRQSARERRAEGRIEFHDLLTFARDLLRHDATVRAKLHDRYPVLLLDEFQDTDPLQIEIALLIATDAPDIQGRPWFELPFQPGRLFVVGDPKQSIYRFRRADLDLYGRARARFGAPQRLGLTANFRSRPAILAWVNALFASLLAPDGDAFGVVDAAPFQALTATCADCPDTPLPVQLLGHAWGKAADLGELRRQEATEIAALVARARAEGWPVRRPTPEDPDHTEPARYGDIAILLPSRATLPYLEEAFDNAAVPVRIESQSLVFATSEVHDLMSILGAIDDPGDEVAVVAALRAPGFGCRDDQLVEFAQAGGHWDYRGAPPESLAAHHPVVAGLRALRELHALRWWESVSDTVGHVIRERRLLELAVAYDRPRDHWRRTQFVADAARSFSEGGGTTLRGFVDWLREQLDEGASAVEVVVPEPDDDAVRILTVHGAKGLEFPIVAIAGLGVRSRIQSPPLLWGESRIEIGFGSKQQRFATAGFEPLRAAERDAQIAEEARLLYVAATRARDHLVVSVHHRVDEKCPATKLLELAGDVPHLWRAASVLDSEPARAAATSPADALAPPDRDRDVHDVEGRAEWRARRAALVAATRRAPTISATALATNDGANELAARARALDPNLESDEPEGDRPAWRRDRAGTAIGRAVHAVLQTVDFASGADLQSVARAQALAEGIPERAQEIEMLAASVLGAPVLELARTHRAWREVPVAAPFDATLVEGFIDLLIEGPDGLIVVDYKTDHVPNDADIDAAVARYRIQGAAYALALESVLSRPVTRVVFVFAHGAVEREITDVRSAIDDVRALLHSRVEANA
jgi:ATP-dependent helicase/nuclease subunit A